MPRRSGRLEIFFRSYTHSTQPTKTFQTGSEGRPVEVPPWRLALVMVMPYMEGLTDRQAADAVRRCMDWK
jgi:Transposase domain (DUF772)